jgi:hypothetical protein
MTTKLLTETEIEEAWRQAGPAQGRDPRHYRIAPHIIQSIIRRDRFNMCGEFGWRIEYGRPVSYRKTSIEEAMKLVQYEVHGRSRPTKRKFDNEIRNRAP